MEKFCPNCGTPLKEGAKFCGGCGAKRPDTASQPAQQTQPQYAPQIPEQKKKSKAPFFIGGGVIAAALVVALIITNVFGLLNHTGGDITNLPGNGSTNNGNNSVTVEDGEDASFFFDWDMIEAFGGMEGFEEWLKYGLGLYADDYYDIISGGSFMSPVERVDEERGWLDGYPAAKD